MIPPGSGDRVVLDPDHLRRVASRMRGGAEMLSSAGRHLLSRPRPDMPVALQDHLGKVIFQANRELQELALELVQEAGDLASRATQAELGGIDSIAWLVPSVHGLRSFSDAPSATLSSSDTFLEGRPPSGPLWAETALQDMSGPVEPSDETGLDLREFAEDLASVSIEGLGEVGPAGVGLDLYVESTAGEVRPETGTARAALATVFAEADLGPTGIGLIGCLVVGGAGGSGDGMPTAP